MPAVSSKCNLVETEDYTDYTDVPQCQDKVSSWSHSWNDETVKDSQALFVPFHQQSLVEGCEIY